MPGPLPNSTVPAGSTTKNITAYSTMKAFFGPRSILQSGSHNFSSVGWPIDEGLKTLRTAQHAIFVLYCAAISLAAVALSLMIGDIFWRSGMVVFWTVISMWAAVVALTTASATVTLVGIKGTIIVNRYGHDIGISAAGRAIFLALTGAMSLAGCTGSA